MSLLIGEHRDNFTTEQVKDPTLLTVWENVVKVELVAPHTHTKGSLTPYLCMARPDLSQ